MEFLKNCAQKHETTLMTFVCRCPGLPVSDCDGFLWKECAQTHEFGFMMFIFGSSKSQYYFLCRCFGLTASVCDGFLERKVCKHRKKLTNPLSWHVFMDEMNKYCCFWLWLEKPLGVMYFWQNVAAKQCIDWESNPGLLLGRQKFYH